MSPTPQQPGVMAEDQNSDMQPGADAGSDQQSTVELPLSAFNGMTPKPGDTLQLKVVSIDANSGVINATPMESGTDDSGGSDSMASEFDNNPKAQT